MKKHADKKPIYILVSYSDTKDGTSLYCDGAYWNIRLAQEEMRRQYNEQLAEIINRMGKECLPEDYFDLWETGASITVDICPPDSYQWEIYKRIVEVNRWSAILLYVSSFFQKAVSALHITNHKRGG